MWTFMNNVIKFFESCKIVEGYQRAIIYDLQKSCYYFVPKYIKYFEGNTLSDIYKKEELYNNSRYWIDFIFEKQLGFLCPTKNYHNFIKIDLTWTMPSNITNAILQIDRYSINIKNVFSQLEEVHCQHLLLLVEDIDIINIIKDLTIESNFKSIDIIIKRCTYTDKELINCIKSNVRIKNIVVCSSDFDKIIYFDRNLEQRILQTKNNNIFNCRRKNNNYTINIFFFTEALCYNTCLNRKIFIDSKGNVKNCPNMAKAYGNINDTKLCYLIDNSSFKELWTLNKDNINICKDCEFRYACTDCRAFVKSPISKYSQPIRCRYNPYICQKEGQKFYIPVEKCGTYDNNNKFVPNKQYIEEVYKEISKQINIYNQILE